MNKGNKQEKELRWYFGPCGDNGVPSNMGRVLEKKRLGLQGLDGTKDFYMLDEESLFRRGRIARVLQTLPVATQERLERLYGPAGEFFSDEGLRDDRRWIALVQDATLLRDLNVTLHNEEKKGEDIGALLNAVAGPYRKEQRLALDEFKAAWAARESALQAMRGGWK